MTRLVLALLASVAGLILVLPALLLALPFWSMSVAVRRFARLTEPRAAMGEELMQFDSALGWKPKSNLTAQYLAADDDIYPIVTDSAGWSGNITLGDSEMVVVGDSFASGYGALKGQAFWELAPELKIKPIGCPGYDMIQEVQALRQLGDQLVGKLVAWFVCLENDIADSLQPHLRGYRKSFVRKSPRTGEWAIVSEHVRPEKWIHSGAADLNNGKILAALCSPGPLSDHYFGACRFLIGEAVAVCRENRATLVMVTVPSRNQLGPAGCRILASLVDNADDFDPDYVDVRLAEACRELGVAFVPAKKYLVATDYKRFETYHWNPSGHRKMAGLLREIRDMWKSSCLGGDWMSSRASAASPQPWRQVS